MYSWVLVAGVVGVLLWETGKRGWRKLTTLGKKSITEYEVQQAREELIRGITEYDLNNSSNGNDVPDGIAPEEGLDEEDEKWLVSENGKMV